MVSVDGSAQYGLRFLGGMRAAADLPLLSPLVPESTVCDLDFRDVAGHEVAKRALQIAAAGRHGVLMMGPPGSGKTCLPRGCPRFCHPSRKKRRLKLLLSTRWRGNRSQQSCRGCGRFASPTTRHRFRLVGEGPLIRPGEITLAHNGVLFLDELSEFKSSVLQGIRQPMETGRLGFTRADLVRFPHGSCWSRPRTLARAVIWETRRPHARARSPR